MNKLGLFCFVKNENDIIENFVNYHLNIFDAISIIDNGSTDGTYEILQSFGNKINLIQNTCHFSLKGDVCSNMMKESDCDLLIPLDADELMIYDDNINISNDNNFIRKYLQELVLDGKKYNINKIYEIYPFEKDYWGIRPRVLKVIFPKSTFMYTDCGFHRGRVVQDNSLTFNNIYFWRSGHAKDDAVRHINISYLHYHFRNKQSWLKSTEQKLRARLGDDWNNINILRNYTGQSRHTAREYLIYLDTGLWCPVKKDIQLKL